MAVPPISWSAEDTDPRDRTRQGYHWSTRRPKPAGKRALAKGLIGRRNSNTLMGQPFVFGSKTLQRPSMAVCSATSPRHGSHTPPHGGRDRMARTP